MKLSLLVIVACVLVGITSAANNCPGAAGSAGVNCTDASLCCGYGTITPSCLPANGSKICCVHYLASTQCNPNQVCGGSGGPGASSYAQCGPPGSTFCDKGDGQGAFCTAAAPTCCGYYGGYGFCCAPGCACNNSAYTCSCPTTVAPTTVAPTTAAPTTTPAPPKNNCPGAGSYAGVNCSDPSLCCGYGSLSPTCLPANGTKKCCTHYLAATQCNPEQVCGGGGGPGASSYAQCGPANSTFCDKGDGQGAFCTAAAPTCCGYYGGYGFCCAAGCACNNSAYTCNCPVTAAPTTVAPTTVAPTTAAPTTTPAPPQNNCPGAASTAGVNCSDPSLCCGYGSMFPSCLPANGTKKCCTHYLAATQCDPDQVCGGGGGPGASSYAQCGPAGSTYCDKGTGQGTFCTAAAPTCCGYYGGFGFCCAPGCACNNSAYTCNCPTTAAPTTVAPTTVAPTTPAPTTTPAPPQNNCPGAGSSAGVNCSDPSLCCGYGSLFPSCLPANGTKKCCTHYLAATQCDPDQVCGGGGGPGASSYAQCGPAGSTYCDKGTGQGTFCTAAAPTCCGYYGGFGFCCAPGCACNNSAYTCSCPTTVAPTTVAPTTAAPTTTPAPPKNNCPGAGSYAGVNCSDPSLCCGYGSLSPTCLPANGTKKCCTHYLAATQCDPDQVCGGGLGPGASSYATCGPPGSTFCDKGTGTGAFCNATLPTCCGYSGGYGFCCAPGCACNNSAYTCSCPTPTTVAPTTAAPTTAPPPMPNCPGVNGYGGVNCSSASLCCGAGTITPSCLPADGSKKCCVHYLSSTQCNPNQVCGGSGGPGASSYAQCGPPGSTFCDKGDGQGAFCNATLPTCCGYYGGYGFCCAPGCACNNSAYTCNCPTPSPKPTDKPTPNRPTPPKPTPPSQKTCRTPGPRGKPATCGVNQQCCGAPNTNSFCCPANKRCNNARRTCF